MPALALVRTRTHWTVTFTNPPVDLIDPELIPDHLGTVNRETLVTAKSLAAAYAAFFASAARMVAA